MATNQRKLKQANKKADPQTHDDHRNKSVTVQVPPDHTATQYAETLARVLTRPEVGAAAVIESWQKDTHDVNALAVELTRQSEAVNRGDLSRAEAMLSAQAHALHDVFVNLARRAVSQDYLKQWEAYMRMAMKAQNQCRMTLETLAAIKSPPVVFARQANINNGGQQQVNNGPAPASGAVRASAQAHAGKPKNDQTGLLGVSDGEWLDTGTAGTASRTDPRLAPVGAIDRAANIGRQGYGVAQR